MKSLQEVMRAKELEVLKVIDDALQQKEAELRQVQKTLLEALRLVNRLLETDNPAVEAALPDTSTAAKRPMSPAPVVTASAAVNPPLTWEQPAKRFP